MGAKMGSIHDIESIDGKVESANTENQQFYGTAAACFLHMMVDLYMIPTAVRLYSENQLSVDGIALSGKLVHTPSENLGAELGFGAGAVVDIAQIFGYYAEATRGNYWVLLIPLGTNVASGIYEASRYIRNKRDEKHREKDLERFIQEHPQA